MCLFVSPTPCKPASSTTSADHLPTTAPLPSSPIPSPNSRHETVDKNHGGASKLAKVKEPASTLRLTAYGCMILFVSVIPVILVFLIFAALPKICRCGSVKLPHCPEAWSDEPCYLWFVGMILTFIFYGGIFAFEQFIKGEEKAGTLPHDNEKI